MKIGFSGPRRSNAAVALALVALATTAGAGDLNKGQLVVSVSDPNATLGYSLRVYARSGAFLETLHDQITQTIQEPWLVGSYFDWDTQALYLVQDCGTIGPYRGRPQRTKIGRRDPHAQAETTFVSNTMAFVEEMPARDAAGNYYFYLGGEPWGCCPFTSEIVKTSPDLAVLDSYEVPVDAWWSGPFDVTADGRLIYYSRPSTRLIERYDTTTRTQLTPWALSTHRGFQFLPPFDGSGLLVANDGEILRLDADGNTVQVYDDGAASPRWWFVELDPEGSSFWAASTRTSTTSAQLYRFDLATGAVLVGPIDLGPYGVLDLHAIPNPPRFAQRR